MAKQFSILAAKSEINVTPMADVMRVRLIIFMLTVPTLKQGLAVNRSQGENPVEDFRIDRAVTVAVARGGVLYRDRDAITADVLGPKRRDRLAGKSNKTVFIKGDLGVPYQRIVAVIELGRGAGAERIGLITDKIKARDPH